MKNLLTVLTLLILGISCSVEPTEINYGKDGCHFCKMTIVDNQHAAQIVTAKGKAYKYDAIECMINDLKQRNEEDIALFLINDYSEPGKLIPARTAVYLISPEIPSPMGAFLSGFSSEEKAATVKAEHGGTLYNWASVKKEVE